MARRTGERSTQERLCTVYDSSLDLPRMERRCPTAGAVGTSEIKNYELLSHGVVTVEPKGGANVPILLWKIEAPDKTALDRYEGWPYLYRKEVTDMELEGKSASAMVYVMNDVHFLRTPLESYYKAIEEGYQTAGFGTAALEHTLGWTKEMMKQKEPQHHQQRSHDLDGFHLQGK